jgi:hypothetical protein
MTAQSKIQNRLHEVNQVNCARGNLHGVAELLLPRSKIDTHLSELLAYIDSAATKSLLNLCYLRLCMLERMVA